MGVVKLSAGHWVAVPHRVGRPLRAYQASLAALDLSTGIVHLYTKQRAVSAPAYRYLFEWFTLSQWGWLFLISGVVAFLALYFPRLWPVWFLPAAVWGAWAAGLWLAVAQHMATGSRAGPLQPTGYAVGSLVAAWAVAAARRRRM